MAVKLHLTDARETDIVAVSTPQLPVATPERFVAMIKAQGRGPRPGLGLPLFLARNPRALLALPRIAPTLALRASYGGIAYHGIHAFKWVAASAPLSTAAEVGFRRADADGRATYVRYTLVPDVPAPKLSGKEARRGGPDYLQNELRDRLASGPIGFTLRLTLAEPADPTNDPSRAWPSGRRQVNAGRLTVEALDTTRERDGDVLVFDPTRVIDGIELSDDPVLHFRAAAYSESIARRAAGSPAA
jgi:catalase